MNYKVIAILALIIGVLSVFLTFQYDMAVAVVSGFTFGWALRKHGEKRKD